MLQLLSKRGASLVFPRGYSKAAAGSEYFKDLIKNQNDSEGNVNLKTDYQDQSERPSSHFKQKPNTHDPKVYAQRLVYFNEYAKKKRKEKQTELKNHEVRKVVVDKSPSIKRDIIDDESVQDSFDYLDQSQFEYYSKTQSTNQSYSETQADMTSSPRDWSQEIKSSQQQADKFIKKNGKARSKDYQHDKARDSSYREPTQNEIRQAPIESNLEIVGRSMTEVKLEEEPLELIDEEQNLTEEEKLERKIRSLRPATRPLVYNLAYFANTSPLVQKLIEMGVAIREWDKDPSIGSFILKLDFDKNIKPYLIFFHDIGLAPDTHAFVITKNPMIFKDPIETLQTRIEYMKSKKFDANSIVEIVTRAPRWLSLTVEELDTKLGWFQKEFQLNGQEVREMVLSQPKLITLPLKIPSDVRFILKDLLTFTPATIKSFLKQHPKLFIKDFKKVEANFIFLNQVAKLSHEEIASCPQVLTESLLTLKSRYAFLKQLDRLQFDPTKPNFVSLKCLTRARTDEDFCKHVAKSTVQEYKSFLKTV